jgi:hypothetical protein
MINKLKLFTLLTAMTLATPQVSYGSDEFWDEDVLHSNPQEIYLPIDIKKEISREVVSSGQSPIKLALLNREWNQVINDILQEGNPVWDAWPGVKTPEDEEIYQMFRNMELIYRPDPNSDEGMIRLPIPMGHNPFKYTFDLSSCGDSDPFVVITNDLERFFTIGGENELKLVICFAMRSWINKNIDSLSAPFNTILTPWDAEQAPVGIFWRWGEWLMGKFDYLTNQPLAQLSNVNLYENWKKSAGGGLAYLIPEEGKNFQVYCEPKLES